MGNGVDAPRSGIIFGLAIRNENYKKDTYRFSFYSTERNRGVGAQWSRDMGMEVITFELDVNTLLSKI